MTCIESVEMGGENPPIKNQCYWTQITPYYKRASAKSDSLTDFTYHLPEKTEEINVLIGIFVQDVKQVNFGHMKG